MGTSLEVYDTIAGANIPVIGSVGPKTYPQINASQPTPRSVGDVWCAPADVLQSYDTAWVYPTMVNGWVTYDATYETARYRKTIDGMVHIEGLVKSGTISTTLPVFTLPTGYRPAATIIFCVVTDPNVAGRMDIQVGGGVIPYSGSNAWFSIKCTFYGSV